MLSDAGAAAFFASDASSAPFFFSVFFFLSFSGDCEDRSTAGLSLLAVGFSASFVELGLAGDEAFSALSLVVLRRLLALGDFGGDGALGGSGLSSTSPLEDVDSVARSSSRGPTTSFGASWTIPAFFRLS